MTAVELISERHRVPGFLEAQALFLDRGWTDGLPIIPPTEELVARFVAAVGGGAQDVVAAIPEQGRVVTVEKIAVNAVMAGCRPEYMPVLVAAMRTSSSRACRRQSSAPPSSWTRRARWRGWWACRTTHSR